jgi:hypothetical protein
VDLRKICIISLHNIKYTGFITEAESVYWAVRAGSLNIILDKFSVQSLNKGKPIQLQAWTGPEVSRSLRLPDFKTIST